jgi:hypothetical protein
MKDQQVRTWALKNEEMRKAGLEDWRGERVGTQPSRTREEELCNRIAQLERKNKKLQKIHQEHPDMSWLGRKRPWQNG